MDYWKLASVHLIGPGGRKCPCCFAYRKKRGRRKVKGLSKLLRSKIKQMPYE